MISFTTELEPRIIVRKHSVYKVQSYDLDNSYPQNIDMLIAASSSASGCVKTYAKFIKGEGFKDKTFYKAKINRAGMTVDQLFRKIAYDYAKFKGFALQFNWNLNGKITEINYVPFEHVRLEDTWPANTAPTKAALYDDWDGRRRQYFMKKKIDWIDLYNPSNVLPSMYEQGVKNFKGQLFYYSDDAPDYPLSPIDPVREDVITDSEIKMFKFRNVTTNFMASHMFSVPEFENDTDRLQFQTNIRKFQGGRKAGKIFTVEYKKKEQLPSITAFAQPNNDKQYEYHEKSTSDNIRKCFGMMGVILGEETPGKLGVSQQMVDAIIHYNSLTKEERIVFEEAFKEIFLNWEGEINPTNDYTIIPVGTGEFIAEGIIETTRKPDLAGPDATIVEPQTEPTDAA